MHRNTVKCKQKSKVMCIVDKLKDQFGISPRIFSPPITVPKYYNHHHCHHISATSYHPITTSLPHPTSPHHHTLPHHYHTLPRYYRTLPHHYHTFPHYYHPTTSLPYSTTPTTTPYTQKSVARVLIWATNVLVCRILSLSQNL